MKDDTPPTPPSLRSLEKRIDNIARDRGKPVRRVQRAIANAVIGQLIPCGVVKGGTAMKLRVGEGASRFTPDLDAVRPVDVNLDEYVQLLAERMADGWGGFTGTITPDDPAEPPGVPTEYVMQPYDIRLAYRGRHWLTVRFELSRDEIGGTDRYDLHIADDLLALFRSLGLETPQPVPVLALDHQIAQKLHACTFVDPRTGANERAHDVVDLQILEQDGGMDLAQAKGTCVRLFASRRGQSWPPTVVSHSGWATIYHEAADGLGVMGDVDSAVEWANALVGRIDAS